MFLIACPQFVLQLKAFLIAARRIGLRFFIGIGMATQRTKEFLRTRGLS
jgi:hypothetical protein